MYEMLDAFCRRPTWDTSHPSDRQIFRAALSDVIRLHSFSPEKMGYYIRKNHTKPIWPNSDAELSKVIDGLVRDTRAALARVEAKQH